MKKTLFIIINTFLVLTLMVTIVFAAPNPDYGPHPYSWDIEYQFRGDLIQSGLGENSTRDSYALWHNLRFKNIVTGDMTPSTGDYIPTVQYDLIESESGDNFTGRRGYHVIPVHEATIRRYAEYMNGNPDYVWEQVNNGHWNVKYFHVKNQKYTGIGSLLYLSGGGTFDSISYVGKNNGVNGPVFDTTMKTTPEPKITSFTADDNNISINSTAYSVYDTKITGWITVNGDPSSKTKVFEKTDGVSNYSITFNGTVPLDTIKEHLKPGENQLTLLVSDSFQRTATKNATVNYQPAAQKSGCTNPYLVHYGSNARVSFDTSFGIDPSYQIGGYVHWNFEYNPYVCMVFDQTVAKNRTGNFKKINEPYMTHDHPVVSFKLWKYAFNYTSNGIKFKNNSDITDPLIGYLVNESGTVLQRIELQKGQEINISVPSGLHTIEFPTPLKESGFWENAETSWSGFPATKNYPSDYQDVLEELINLPSK